MDIGKRFCQLISAIRGMNKVKERKIPCPTPLESRKGHIVQMKAKSSFQTSPTQLLSFVEIFVHRFIGVKKDQRYTVRTV